MMGEGKKKRTGKTKSTPLMMDVSHWRLRAGLSAGTRRREGSTWGRAVAVSRIRGDQRSLWPEFSRTPPKKNGRMGVAGWILVVLEVVF